MINNVARVVDRLHPFELQFLVPIDRFQRVCVYDVAFTKTTRGKPFRMRNPTLWDVMLADRDMFVIDFRRNRSGTSSCRQAGKGSNNLLHTEAVIETTTRRPGDVHNL